MPNQPSNNAVVNGLLNPVTPATVNDSVYQSVNDSVYDSVYNSVYAPINNGNNNIGVGSIDANGNILNAANTGNITVTNVYEYEYNKNGHK
jgi:hypothetical protein